jgi:hypothetical protein
MFFFFSTSSFRRLTLNCGLKKNGKGNPLSPFWPPRFGAAQKSYTPKRKSIMLTTSLVGTKVTAATRVQTVKRNTTVRAATQKVGAKGKKKGEKVRR